jgi:acylphosphatase
MDLKEIACIVTGKVQGVGYREFAAKHARALWIVGTIKNTEPSIVHVIAQGTEEKLMRFLEYLRKGSFLARVRDVTVEWREPVQTFKDFDILF